MIIYQSGLGRLLKGLSVLICEAAAFLGRYMGEFSETFGFNFIVRAVGVLGISSSVSSFQLPHMRRKRVEKQTKLSI